MGGCRGERVEMNDPFITIDLHGLMQEDAKKAINRALASAGPYTYQIRVIHGYHRGTNLRGMIQYHAVRLCIQHNVHLRADQRVHFTKGIREKRGAYPRPDISDPCRRHHLSLSSVLRI